MKPELKMWINRGGLVAMVIGVIVFIATGGDAGSAGQIVGTVASITGAALVLIRELIG